MDARARASPRAVGYAGPGQPRGVHRGPTVIRPPRPPAGRGHRPPGRAEGRARRPARHGRRRGRSRRRREGQGPHARRPRRRAPPPQAEEVQAGLRNRVHLREGRVRLLHRGDLRHGLLPDRAGLPRRRLRRTRRRLPGLRRGLQERRQALLRRPRLRLRPGRLLSSRLLPGGGRGLRRHRRVRVRHDLPGRRLYRRRPGRRADRRALLRRPELRPARRRLHRLHRRRRAERRLLHPAAAQGLHRRPRLHLLQVLVRQRRRPDRQPPWPRQHQHQGLLPPAGPVLRGGERLLQRADLHRRHLRRHHVRARRRRMRRQRRLLRGNLHRRRLFRWRLHRHRRPPVRRHLRVRCPVRLRALLVSAGQQRVPARRTGGAPEGVPRRHGRNLRLRHVWLLRPVRPRQLLRLRTDAERVRFRPRRRLSAHGAHRRHGLRREPPLLRREHRLLQRRHLRGAHPEDPQAAVRPGDGRLRGLRGRPVLLQQGRVPNLQQRRRLRRDGHHHDLLPRQGLFRDDRSHRVRQPPNLHDDRGNDLHAQVQGLPRRRADRRRTRRRAEDGARGLRPDRGVRLVLHRARHGDGEPQEVRHLGNRAQPDHRHGRDRIRRAGQLLPVSGRRSQPPDPLRQRRQPHPERQRNRQAGNQSDRFRERRRGGGRRRRDQDQHAGGNPHGRR